MTALEHRRVSPFGHLRLSRSYTPHRSFSQYNTSFIGTRCLGIHCVPLLAFRTIVRSLRLSWHARLGITFALIIQFLRRTRRISFAAHNSLRYLQLLSKGESNHAGLSQLAGYNILRNSAPGLPANKCKELDLCANKSKESYSFPSIFGSSAYIPSFTCTWRTSGCCGILKSLRQSSP